MKGTIEYIWKEEREGDWYLYLGNDRVARIVMSLPNYSYHPRWLSLRLNGRKFQSSFQELPIWGIVFDDSGKCGPGIKPNATIEEMKEETLKYFGIEEIK